jgi:hypothetical protein
MKRRALKHADFAGVSMRHTFPPLTTGGPGGVHSAGHAWRAIAQQKARSTNLIDKTGCFAYLPFAASRLCVRPSDFPIPAASQAT